MDMTACRKLRCEELPSPPGPLIGLTLKPLLNKSFSLKAARHGQSNVHHKNRMSHEARTKLLHL